MTHFINDKTALVTEAIDGFLHTSSLARLDGYPHIKVVVRTDHDKSKVALISGGGSGHEPAHAGFVGKGMLTAAVCGEVFASPSVEAVLAGILAVTGEGGCLLIVKNYTGDRLNFGLAAERAKALGKQVEMVVVADDVALPDLPQPRGVAGTLFVHKIAGYAAEQGESLNDVAMLARAVAGQTRSYGVALDSCTIPGSAREQRIDTGKAELGLGIHGEPGVETIAYTDALNTTGIVLDSLFKHTTGIGQIVLLNNLGSATPLEMSVITQNILNGPHKESIKAVVGPAQLMTSLDMHGFSLSLLPADDSYMAAMSASVEPAAWPIMQTPRAVSVVAMPEGLSLRTFAASENADRAQLIKESCAAFETMENDLNTLDAKTGDGDTGSTLATAARSLSGVVDTLPLADDVSLFRALSDHLATSMGGSSGVLLAIFFSASGEASANGVTWSAALHSGLQKMQEYGGAEPGHRTMIDALSPALSVLAAGGSMLDAANAARRGADTTATMTRAKSGRSAYVPESALAGVVDPGAEGVARYFEFLAERNG